MPKANHTDTISSTPTPHPTQALSSRASRRQLFAGIGRTAVAGALAAIVLLEVDAAEHPDAELLRVLARFGHLEETIWPAGGTGCQTIEEEDDRARLVAPLRAEQAALVDHACALRAITLDGLRARAQVLLLWDTELPTADTPESCIDDRMLAALIRDLVGGGVA